MKKIIVLFILAAALIFPATTMAQGLGDAGKKLGSFNTGLSSDLPGTIQTMIKGGFYVVGTVFLLLGIYGGLIWLKAAGREEEVNRAKKIIIAAVIGLAVIFASYALTIFTMGRAMIK